MECNFIHSDYHYFGMIFIDLPEAIHEYCSQHAGAHLKLEEYCTE